MMRCLVTGASGHIGSALVRTLKREGCDVMAIGRASDLRQIGDFAPEVVFHLAWSGIDRVARENASQIHENIPYSLRVFRAAADAGARVWIGVGSQAEYNDPHSPYGVAKHVVAMLTEKLCSLANIRYVWMRLVATYGPADDDRHLIPMLIRALQAGETPALTSGTQFVDYLHVDDVAEALWAAAIHENASGVFDLASGTAVRVRELAELVRDVVAPRAELGFGAISDPGVADLRADISRFREATGWSPRINLRDGIARTASA